MSSSIIRQPTRRAWSKESGPTFNTLCDLEIESPRQQNEYGMAIRLNAIRMMMGSQWTPLEVQFAHQAPDEISEHQRIFGAPVLFGYKTNNFVIESELLTRQVPAADPPALPDHETIPRGNPERDAGGPRRARLGSKSHCGVDERWRPQSRACGQENGR
jgi:hypothetical protein